MSEAVSYVRQELVRQGHSEAALNSLVISEQFAAIFELLYQFFLQSSASFVLAELDEQPHIIHTEADSAVRLSLPQAKLQQLNELLHKRTKIGTVGGKALYFDISKQRPFSLDEIPYILGDPIQSNIDLVPEFQQAFAQLAVWGEVTEAITHQSELYLTLFLADGSTRVIETTDPLYRALTSIFSEVRVQIGRVIEDPLMYHSGIGFYNGRTGKKVSATDLETADLYTQGRAPFAAVRLPEDSTEQQVGLCAGGTGAFFSLNEGVTTRPERMPRNQVFVEMRNKIANDDLLELIAPTARLHYSTDKRSIYQVQFGKKVQAIHERDRYFSIMSSFLEGKIGRITYTGEGGEDWIFTVAYSEELGFSYDTQPAAAVPESVFFEYFNLNLLGVPDTVRKNFGLTTKQKRRKERGRLPRGRK